MGSSDPFIFFFLNTNENSLPFLIHRLFKNRPSYKHRSVLSLLDDAQGRILPPFKNLNGWWLIIKYDLED